MVGNVQTKPTQISKRHNKGFAGIRCFWFQGKPVVEAAFEIMFASRDRRMNEWINENDYSF